MYNKIRDLFKSSSGYALGNMIGRALYLISMPIMTRYLAPAEYGTLSVVNAVSGLLMTLFGFGAQDFIMRFYYEQKTESDTRHFLGGIFVFFLAATFCLALLLTVAGYHYAHVFFEGIPFFPFLFLGIWISFVSNIEMVPDSLFRLLNEVKTYVSVKLTKTVMNIALALFFVVALHMGAAGPLLASLIVAALMGAYYFAYLKDKIALHMSAPLVGQCLKFSSAIVLLLVGRVLLETSDRLLLQHFADLAVVGYYSIGSTVGSVLILIAFSIDAAWAPFYYSTASEPDTEKSKELIAYASTYLAGLLLFIGLCPAVLKKEIVYLLAPPSYYPVIDVIPLIMVGAALNALFFFPVRGIYQQKKTHLLPLIIVAGLAASICLNVLLIPAYQIYGAAIAGIGSAAVMLAIGFGLSQKCYHIPYQYGRLLKIVIACLACYGVSLLVPAAHVIATLIMKSLVLLLFPGLLHLFGFFEQREITRLKEIAARVTGRGASSAS